MFNEDFIKRFEAKFVKGGEDDCWEWQGAGGKYGFMKLPGSRINEYSHRLSYMIYKAEFEGSDQVLHECDNPRCVNPRHLFLGSQKQNMQDMKMKDRHLNGEKNSKAKLTEDQVKEILGWLELKEFSQKTIAAEFGVGQMEISRISRGLRWRHITDPNNPELSNKDVESELIKFPRSTLSDEDIERIRELAKTGLISQAKLGELFKVNQSAISKIVSHKRRDIDDVIENKNVKDPDKRNLNECQLEEIKSMYKNGFAIKKIAETFNCSKRRVKRIVGAV